MGNNASKKQAAEKHNYHNDWRAAIREDRKRYPEKYGFTARTDSQAALISFISAAFSK